ncbi:MAG: HIT domain-containing protein [Minwuia sp.]|nr:HIT domain-containing protein [Minwuia sp.]
MAEFEVDPRLVADSVQVMDLPLCAVRLVDDSRWPWLLLIPRRPGVTEIFELNQADRGRLMEETAAVARAVTAVGPCDKTNVATLGNMVAQMHVHVIARQIGDPAWPGPIWGIGKPVPYARAERVLTVETVRVLIETEIVTSVSE